jgi:hypothetical protein
VQDNLNPHKPASLYEAFSSAEARRLVERFEWHYTPKHGSWLDMAESELGETTKPSSMKSPLGRRIETPTTPRPIGSSPHPKHVSDTSIYTRQSGH